MAALNWRLFGHLVQNSYVTLLKAVMWVLSHEATLYIKGGCQKVRYRMRVPMETRKSRKEDTPLCERKSVKVKFSYLNKWLLSTYGIVFCRTDRRLLGQ